MDGTERWFTSNGTATHIAFSPDSNFVAASVADRTIRILESGTGHEVARLTGNLGAIRSLSFTFDSTQLVSVGDDKLIRIWNWRPTIPERVLDAGQILSRVRVSSDGSSVWSTGDGLKSLNVNDSRFGFELPSSHGRRDVDYSDDGARIVVLNGTNANDEGPMMELGELQVLDARSGREISVLHPLEKERAGSSITQEFRISPSGKRAALVSQTLSPQQQVTESKVEIWDNSGARSPPVFTSSGRWSGRFGYRQTENLPRLLP